MTTSVADYIENLEKKVRRLERELEEAKEEISTFKSEDLSVLYKDTINDVYENFKRNSDIYRVDTTENEGGLKLSLVQWSPKGTKVEDFKMLILDIRLLQTKEDIRVRVSIRVKVPDVNPTLLKNHKDTSKFEITYSKKDFIKLSSTKDLKDISNHNVVSTLIKYDPIFDMYSPDKFEMLKVLDSVLGVYLYSGVNFTPYLNYGDYLGFINDRVERTITKCFSKNIKGNGVLIYGYDKVLIDLSEKK